MRILDYIGVVIRDIRTQPVRILLTLTSIIISSMLFVTLVSLGLGSRQAIMSQLTADDTVKEIIVSSSSSISSGLFSSSVQISKSDAKTIDDTDVDKINSLIGIKSVDAQVAIWEFKDFKIDDTGSSFVARTIATPQRDSKLTAGSWYNTNDTSPVVVIGYGYVRALGLEKNPESLIGKNITITTQDGYRGQGAKIPTAGSSRETINNFANSATEISAKIVGVTNPSINDNRLYIPIGWAHQIKTVQYAGASGITTEDTLDKNGYTNLVVSANNDNDVKSLTSKIENMGYGVSTYQKQIDQMNQLSTILWIVLGAVALVSIISASLGIINTLLISISEQSQVISIWRAAGATKFLIAQMYVMQATIVGLVGGTIGSIVGMYISQYINGMVTKVLQAQGLESIALPPTSLRIIALSIGLTVLLSAAAGVYPAYRAAKKAIV